MKYPFLIVLVLVLFSTLVFMMFASAALSELGIFLDRKKVSEF